MPQEGTRVLRTSSGKGWGRMWPGSHISAVHGVAGVIRAPFRRVTTGGVRQPGRRGYGCAVRAASETAVATVRLRFILHDESLQGMLSCTDRTGHPGPTPRTSFVTAALTAARPPGPPTKRSVCIPCLRAIAGASCGCQRSSVHEFRCPGNAAERTTSGDRHEFRSPGVGSFPYCTGCNVDRQGSRDCPISWNGCSFRRIPPRSQASVARMRCRRV